MNTIQEQRLRRAIRNEVKALLKESDENPNFDKLCGGKINFKPYEQFMDIFNEIRIDDLYWDNPVEDDLDLFEELLDLLPHLKTIEKTIHKDIKILQNMSVMIKKWKNWEEGDAPLKPMSA